MSATTKWFASNCAPHLGKHELFTPLWSATACHINEVACAGAFSLNQPRETFLVVVHVMFLFLALVSVFYPKGPVFSFILSCWCCKQNITMAAHAMFAMLNSGARRQREPLKKTLFLSLSHQCLLVTIFMDMGGGERWGDMT